MHTVWKTVGLLLAGYVCAWRIPSVAAWRHSAYTRPRTAAEIPTTIADIVEIYPREQDINNCCVLVPANIGTLAAAQKQRPLDRDCTGQDPSAWFPYFRFLGEGARQGLASFPFGCPRIDDGCIRIVEVEEDYQGFRLWVNL
jgi:hypothetical protein